MLIRRHEHDGIVVALVVVPVHDVRLSDDNLVERCVNQLSRSTAAELNPVDGSGPLLLPAHPLADCAVHDQTTGRDRRQPKASKPPGSPDPAYCPWYGSRWYCPLPEQLQEQKPFQD